jgi:hypothetical protein
MMTKKESKILETLKMTDGELDKAVKIQGTPYDRKRKVSKDTLKKMLSMAKKNKTYQEIARKLGMNSTTVRYNIDPVWRAAYNAKRDGKHTGKDKVTILDRIAYKRTLVAEGKVTA